MSCRSSKLSQWGHMHTMFLSRVSVKHVATSIVALGRYRQHKIYHPGRLEERIELSLIAQHSKNIDAWHNRIQVRKLKSQFSLISYKGLFTLDTQCALNRIESGLSASTLNAHSPNPDPIRINSNPLPEVVSIRIELDCTIVPCM